MSDSKRKSLSKKIRFEVFKRDRFACQYCGRSAPDVVLEVDHIKPVAEGGSNDFMNLITSCYDCNRGKGKRELSDDAIVKKQMDQLHELAERREQLAMLLEWRNELIKYDNNCISSIEYIFHERCKGACFSEHGRKEMRKIIRKFSMEEVIEAADIAIDTYYNDDDPDTVGTAMSKLYGICYNRKHPEIALRQYYTNYIAKMFSDHRRYVNRSLLAYYIKENVSDNETFETLKSLAKKAGTWSNFKDMAEETIGGKFSFGG